MAEKWAKAVAALLMMSCMAAHVPTGLSVRVTEKSQPFYVPAGTGSGEGCWKAITGFAECGTQFYGAIVTGSFKGVEPTCCQVISVIVESCWRGMFPFGPGIPPALKRYCVDRKQLYKTTSAAMAAKPLISRNNLN